ncbi:MAG: hypothetical protein WAS55_05770 [Saprospiraceae bacterium]
MKYIILFSFSIFFHAAAQSQHTFQQTQRGKKGSFYFYWGWNRAQYTASDIEFNGPSYDFTLDNVRAKDRFSKLSFKTYLNPGYITIPQYNFKLGYYLNDIYSISLGNDHMKYIVQNNQRVQITGKIGNTGTKYDGSYEQNDLILAEDFLKFEHSDGLNYFNLDFNRLDKFLDCKKVKFHFIEGFGAGVVITKTNSTLLNNDRHDAFHLSGYGVNALFGINIEFFKHFFIQSEEKFGFINLPNIRTTKSNLDQANQNFFFYQFNVVLGAVFHLNRAHKTEQI